MKKIEYFKISNNMKD